MSTVTHEKEAERWSVNLMGLSQARGAMPAILPYAVLALFSAESVPKALD